MPAITQPVLDNDLGLADSNDLGFVGFDNRLGHSAFGHAKAANDLGLTSWGLDRI